jgi:hypothetical protein
VFQSHQVGSRSIYGNPPETVGPELLVLLNKHIDNFAARLTKTYEKYAHLVTPSNGLTDNYFLPNPLSSLARMNFNSTVQKLSYLIYGVNSFFPAVYGAFFISP